MNDMESDSILLIDKPAGWTSFDVVAKIRGYIRRSYAIRGVKPTKRQMKVGHAGTLDPFATGLLVILLGEYTKKATEFLKLDKVYEATFCLGKVSSTGDPEGEITDVSNTTPTNDQIQQAVQAFMGKIMQRPPGFSAIKVNGVRAYKLAREGKDVELPEREVVIHSLDVISYNYPLLKVRAHVGSGTYIRSLGADIGEYLGVGAYCAELRRTNISNWSVTDAKQVADFETTK